ncbi:MAG: hypothetical protein AMXMBFR59_10460 [Rhodanobacteraceae bacterium]
MESVVPSHDTDSGFFQSALPIDAKLEKARLRLLDLSARNRLLNIPRSKSRSGNLIEIVDERASEVFRLLVKESRALTFMPGRTAGDGMETHDADEIADLAQPEDDGVDIRGVANRHADTRLQTRLTSKGLQKRLLTLFFDARTLEEEQGVNVLYLALGTLKWIDPNNAANVRYAPLILVPVSLDRATAGDRFKLRWRQEDPSSNLSLEALVDIVHLLKLPAFEATDDFEIDAYCAAVREAVSSKAGWEVATDDIVLGFFSFSKFLMYRDLSPDAWPASGPLADQPLIRSLLRDGFPAPEPGLPDDAPIDPALPPQSLLHIVDSDSSQTIAVHDVRQGRNLVIQGPPGTGKSQTIANVIAGAVADGKTVLFVAEKMAALEVVKRRLDATGVGDACLELHSNKTNKRRVLDELRRTWELGSPKGAAMSSLLRRLTAARDALNTHVDRLHRRHERAELSPYDVVGQLVRLRDEGVAPNDLALGEPAKWSADGFKERRVLVKELSERVALIGRPADHPWRGTALDAILPNQLSRLLDRVGTLRSDLQTVADGMQGLARLLELEPPTTTAGLEPMRALAHRLASAPPLEAVALGHSAWDERRADIDALLLLGSAHREIVAGLAGQVRDPGTVEPLDAVLETLAALPETFGPDAFAHGRWLADALPQLVIEAGRLKNLLGLDGAVDTLAAVSKAAVTGQRVAAAPDASPEVFAAAIWDNGVEVAARLADAVAKLEDVRKSVGARVVAAAWTTDTRRERQLVRLKGTSLFRWLSGDWRRANAVLRSLARDPKTPAQELLDLLDIVEEGRGALAAVKEGETLGSTAFGSDWHGEHSRSAPLKALVAWMRSLRGLGAAPRLIAARLPDRTDIGARTTRVHRLLNEIRPHLEAFWNDLGASALQDTDEATSAMTARLSGVLARATEVAKADAVARQLLIQPDVSATKRRAVLARVHDAQRHAGLIDSQSELGSWAFDSWWRGPETDWSACASAAAWIRDNADVRRLAATLEPRSAPMENADATSASAAQWHAAFTALLSDLRASSTSLFATPAPEQTPMTDILARFALWSESGEQLSKWTAYRERAERARQLGLGDAVARLDDGRLAHHEALAAFEMAYFEALLGDMVRTDGELARFDGELHGRSVREFVALDRESLQASRVDVVQAHHRKLPPKYGGLGPVGILRGEMAKKIGLMPVRQLMQRAAPAVQALKPVFMMSPLSVAQFLPAGQVKFDLLVMDEASQIQPVDALGAVARCRQVVVVGDERQLPPTRFFAKAIEGDEDDEDDDAGAPVQDVESILSLFSARGLARRMLRWHYRSRHQSLIAVSNSQFYENRLIIVPSPYTAEAGMGLSFHHLPSGVFETGAGANAIEAKEVAQAIVRHARSRPDQSLGVATFSVRQRRAILDQLEILRREHSETEAFFDAHPSEPFFVKNLENVQGDERDVIFISVGYGRNAQGVMSMRFGPLGAQGGERRLNVLISRAKLRCEVFSSITDDDIDLERARGVGVVAFKLFLRFARTGRMDLPGADAAGVPDVFESQVAAGLRARGYDVHPRVGIAGLYIDLAVSDPELPGRYVLGIECDGRSYEAARSARDRDRLRRAVLEDHGWVMHRIWAFDWLHRPVEEMGRLVAAIEAAKAELREAASIAARRTRALPVDVVTIDREDGTEIGLGPPGTESSGAPAYRVARVHPLRNYPDIPSVPAALLGGVVESVVREEGPVHADVVLNRIRDAWGMGRAGGRIRAAVEEAIALVVRSNRIRRSGEFLAAADAPVVVRDRSNAADVRKPDWVAPEEIEEAIVQIVRRNLGVKPSELATAVTKLLGFTSTTQAWRDLTMAQVTKAQRRGRIAMQDDMLVISQPPD